MAADSNDIELSRLRLGAGIVGGSIIAVIIALFIVTRRMASEISTSDVVAMLGSVTTFLGLAVGILFGVNAGNSARAMASDATTQLGTAAGKVADAAATAANSARQATEAAARTVDSSHAALRELTSQPRVAPAGQSASSPQDNVEDLAGDPDDVHTRMVLSAPRASDDLARSVVQLAAPVAASSLFPQTVLKVANAEADSGVSRSTNRARVTEYLKLLGFNFLDEHGIPTRFCAAGVTWATCKAYCDANGIAYTPATELATLHGVLGDIDRLYFKPSAGCQVIMNDARARGTFMPATQTPLPGYLVFYNWEGGTHAEHIGLVEGADTSMLRTVEFNTTVSSGPNQGDGGAVSRKSRPLKFVLGYAKTY